MFVWKNVPYRSLNDALQRIHMLACMDNGDHDVLLLELVEGIQIRNNPIS